MFLCIRHVVVDIRFGTLIPILILIIFFYKAIKITMRKEIEISERQKPYEVKF